MFFMPHFSHLFEHWQSTLNWSPTPDQIDQFEKLYELVLEGNSKQNLTRITAAADFWEKHLWDSLRGVLAFVRAVGKPDICADYALPFLKKSGTAVLYRGQWLPEESEHLDIFCEQQGLQVVKQDRFQTPLTAGIRHSVYLSPRSTSNSNS